MTYICILGRQPALGRAELESRFGADALKTVQPDIVLLEAGTPPDFDSFGGIQKVAKLLTRLEQTDINKVVRYLQKALPDHLKYMPEGKITLGISVHGLRTSPQQINAAALSLKKVIKQSGRSARVVPNNELFLNTAQVLHNRLTGPNGLELLLVSSDGSTLLGQTLWVQDIDAYRRRDQERPARDARVGMLPPKLAQIILNLARGASSDADQETWTVLDPFCGTGVLLQEALLQSYNVVGTDLEPRMIEYSQKNLDWLSDMTNQNFTNKYSLKVADATSATWSTDFDMIAGETYLGRALSSTPDPETLTKIIHDVNIIHKKFLQNTARQIPAGMRLCIAIPAWKTKNGFKHLPVLDHLEELGYNRVSFVHAERKDLIYHREGQIVARELVVLTRK